MQTLSFDVSGMTCGGCTGSVQRALSKLDGVSHAEVTLSPGLATVEADPTRVTPAQIESAITEHVMGFCSKEEHDEFMGLVPKFEELLVNSGIKLLKHYLDVSKDEQTRRLAERKRDPLKQWKSSLIDAVAIKHWKAYSEARDTMLLRTHTAVAPWHIVRADDKRLARLNLMRDILSRLHNAGKKTKLVQPDPDVAFEFTPDCIAAKRLAR